MVNLAVGGGGSRRTVKEARISQRGKQRSAKKEKFQWKLCSDNWFEVAQVKDPSVCLRYETPSIVKDHSCRKLNKFF